MADDSEGPIEEDLVEDALALTELAVVDTKVQHFADNTTVRVVMRENPDLLAGCGLGLIYAMSALSFRDARPRGISDMHYNEVDDWTAGDLLRHLRYERGRIVFYADYVRGRMMKTTIEIDRDGSVLLETANRGESATRWVATIQGKRVVSLLDVSAPSR